MEAATLTLQNGVAAWVDVADLDALARYRWLCLGGYVVRQQRTSAGTSTLIYLHRQLLAARPGEVVDHINNNRLDNRRANLRLCSQSENLANRPAPMPHGFRGVYPERNGTWRAQIKVGGVNKRLGTFRTPKAAALAYDAAARAAFGRFARLNFPDEGVEQLALTLLPIVDEADPFDLPAPAHWPAIDGYEIAMREAWRRSRLPAPIADLGRYDDL